jgi:MFS family permease
MKSLMRIRDFRLLWAGQATSSLGDAITNLALLLTAQRLTGSVSAVAATAIAIALPQLLIGMPAGVLVDRWDRRTVMIVSDVARGVLVLGFLLVTSADQLWLMWTIAFAQAAVGSFFNPARGAIVPDIVGRERLMAANSVSETTRVVFGVIGTGIAGVYAGFAAGLAMLFVIDSITFFVSAILETRIATRGRPERTEPKALGAELLEGLRTITATRPLIGVLTGVGVAMLGLGAVNVLLIPFVVDDLGVAETWFGALEAAQVSSMVLAGALLAALAGRARPGAVMSMGLAGAGLVVGSMALVSEAWHLMIALFMIGWFVTPLQASAHTILQREVDPSMLGRAGAGFSTMSTTANVASMALAGVAATFLGVRGVFLAAGALTMVAGAFAWALTRGHSAEPAPAPAVAVGPPGEPKPLPSA